LTLITQRSNLKCKSKIHSTQRPSNHNCKNIRLHAKTDDRNTFSSATAYCTTAKTVSTDVFFNTSSRAQVCAWNSAKPGLRYRNNKGGKYTQSQNSAGHSCRNTLRLCVNGLPVTRCRALQVCAWNVAHPALVDINKQGSKTHSAFEQSCSQLQKHEISRVRGLESTKLSFKLFCYFPLLVHLENVTSCSVSQGVRRTPLHTQSISHC